PGRAPPRAVLGLSRSLARAGHPEIRRLGQPGGSTPDNIPPAGLQLAAADGELGRSRPPPDSAPGSGNQPRERRGWQHDAGPVGDGKPFKDPADGRYPQARYLMDDVAAQDYMAWETQGLIADRTTERLATSDRGVVMLREMLRREIDRVQQGLDPLGVIRDPDHEMIDTGLLRSVREYFGRDRSQSRGQRQPVGA